MKKLLKISVLVFLLSLIGLVFVACDNRHTPNPPTEENPPVTEAEKLAAPTNLNLSIQLNNDIEVYKLSWDEVENAQSYIVGVGTYNVESQTAEYDLSSILTVGSIYDLRVTAVGDGEIYSNSDWSETYQIEAYEVSDCLEFIPLEDNTYEATIISQTTDTELIFPDAYNGKEVTKVTKTISFSVGSINKVKLPCAVTEIGESVFSGFGLLTDINLPKTLKVIKYQAFYNSGLTKIVIPDGVTEIGNSAFQLCVDLAELSLPQTVEYIGISAFSGCVQLKEINIPNSVKYVGGKAFYNTLWENNLPKGIKYINNVLYKYIGEMPNGTAINNIPSNITIIADYAFSSCEGLKQITIPKSIMEIGTCAFSGCTKLTVVNINSENAVIGDSAFSRCSDLVNVDLPKNLTKIPDRIFDNCESLYRISIPQSVIKIGKLAFNETAFYNEESNWENGVLYLDNCLIKANNDITGLYIVKEDTRLIADSAFARCKQLTEVIIPQGVVEIGRSTFNGCNSLKTITIPKSVTKIVYFAFVGCDSLTTINFGGTMEQWLAIEKEYYWCDPLGTFTVICTDGKLDKEGNIRS